MWVASSKGGKEQSPFPLAAALAHVWVMYLLRWRKEKYPFPRAVPIAGQGLPRAGGRCCFLTCPPQLQAQGGQGGLAAALAAALLLFNTGASSDHGPVRHSLEINLSGTRINKTKLFLYLAEPIPTLLCPILFRLKSEVRIEPNPNNNNFTISAPLVICPCPWA